MEVSNNDRAALKRFKRAAATEPFDGGFHLKCLGSDVMMRLMKFLDRGQRSCLVSETAYDTCQTVNKLFKRYVNLSQVTVKIRQGFEAAAPPAIVVSKIKSLPRLRLIDLENYRSIRPANLHELASAPSVMFPELLSALVLRGCTALSDSSVTALLYRLENLVALDLRNCFSLTEKSIVSLKFLPKLQRIALGSTDASVGMNRHGNASLRSLFQPSAVAEDTATCNSSSSQYKRSLHFTKSISNSKKLCRPASLSAVISKPRASCLGIENVSSLAPNFPHQTRRIGESPTKFLFDSANEFPAESSVRKKLEKMITLISLRALIFTKSSQILTLDPLYNCRHSLEWLDLSGSPIAPHSAKVFKTLKNLLILNVSGTGLSNEALITIASSCSKLATLDCSKLSCISRGLVGELCSRLPNLSRVKFAGCENVCTDCVRHLIGTLGELQWLDVSSCWQITQAIVRSPVIVASANRFRRLGISQCSIDATKIAHAYQIAGASKLTVELHSELTVCPQGKIYFGMKMSS